VRQQIFNNRLDAAVTVVFVTLVLALLVEAGLQWWRVLSRSHGQAEGGNP
jgi:hypothetical protein